MVFHGTKTEAHVSTEMIHDHWVTAASRIFRYRTLEVRSLLRKAALGCSLSGTLRSRCRSPGKSGSQLKKMSPLECVGVSQSVEVCRCVFGALGFHTFSCLFPDLNTSRPSKPSVTQNYFCLDVTYLAISPCYSSCGGLTSWR
ncbi:hypothetical protein TNCV_4170621 [Trichonephila clavipes]|nr:hypothetical protein TNCV_4170621 [Trichonephila clavipes]